MTNKQQNILNIALELFANEGFSATSTSKIAKTAGVSEALIFRHFQSKKGLLTAIVNEAEIKSFTLFEPIFLAEDPKQVIRKVLELPFSIPSSEFDFWKLQFKLKWQKEYDHPEKMKPLLEKLTIAFTALKYKEPCKEATLINQLLFAISTEILKGNLQNQKQYKEFLLNRYQV
jgi:AcrR family transcriptional regulator